MYIYVLFAHICVPDVSEVLKVLKLVRENQPIYTYRLASLLGDRPVHHMAMAFKWIHYFEELGVLELVNVDPKTKRKEYRLSELGETLCQVMERVWGKGEPRVSRIYDVRRRGKRASA
jgi:hypothetical protein